MRLSVIETGKFKLDGGAMFGVVPKSIWNKLNPADENNMCTWAMRCLLVEKGNRLVLIDCGIGNKQDEKFFSHYYLHGDDNLLDSIKKAGYSPEEITDVFLTHLHFDHCGGALKWNENRTTIIPVFPNAVYWSNSRHWEWATNPNAREKASFLKENILPLKELGVLKFTDQETFDVFDIIYCSGHTDHMMLPKIKYKEHTIVFMADLLPSYAHIPIPYVMAYDTRPLLTLEEKQSFLNEAYKNNYLLFFEHDPVNVLCNLKQTEKGIRMDQSINFNDIL